MTNQPANLRKGYRHGHLKIKLKAKTTKTKGIKKDGKPRAWKRRLET
jgi:hypothetical protein